jgi:cellulose synthase/poly-beta-1,6-N-acetylglucosamine synthase-like glycosyltransferase
MSDLVKIFRQRLEDKKRRRSNSKPRKTIYKSNKSKLSKSPKKTKKSLSKSIRNHDKQQGFSKRRSIIVSHESKNDRIKEQIKQFEKELKILKFSLKKGKSKESPRKTKKCSKKINKLHNLYKESLDNLRKRIPGGSKMTKSQAINYLLSM